MLFGHNYFNVRMNGKKVKIDTDKTEFTVTVKNGKATFTVEAEPIVTDECDEFDCCDCCPGSGEINEVVVEDNTNDITKSEVIDDEPVKTTKTSKKKTLDTVC